ncbi:hypothetical protein [Kaistella antarctica]|uniref:Lipoprotein n=1 Tax=Kaistella antarctica TaxID=266748 RepID=A0A448NST0_9FLAO|nr:hypothetical protein [Kaistella antarctica]KEY17955.1 hypothetical protein HY04_05345 [Kaistella antarctica]SEV81599.1 hypothetical protein SAMN05421765_0269 [Kaistella antarctica]VEI00378.1 Uncharacterised protein [Kaistella antarctica]
MKTSQYKNLLITTVLLLFSCNDNNIKEKHILQESKTELLDYKFEQDSILDKVDVKISKSLKDDTKDKTDNLFLDFKYGINDDEIQKTTNELIIQKKIRKEGDKLYYDLFTSSKIFQCEIYLNNNSLKPPNKLNTVALICEYFPFDKNLNPNLYDLDKVKEVLLINNRNFNSIKKLYIQKYGLPKENDYGLIGGRGDKAVFEIRYPDLAKESNSTHPKALIFESGENIVELASTVYGGFCIIYHSKKNIIKRYKEENSKSVKSEKDSFDDI